MGRELTLYRMGDRGLAKLLGCEWFFFPMPCCSVSLIDFSMDFPLPLQQHNFYKPVLSEEISSSLPPSPASITPFCIGHQALVLLDMFQVRCFGLVLNYSLKKPMQISRKLNWPVQFGCLAT